MKHLFAKFLDRSRWHEVLPWIKRISDINLFDPDVCDYKATEMVVAYSSEGSSLAAPVQTVYMIESLGPRPGCSEWEEATALKEIVKALVFKSHELGRGEIYFTCDDPRIIKFAQAQGFILRDIALLQMKVKQ